MIDTICQNRITYHNDIQHSYMAIKLMPEQKIIDYQIRMLQENPAEQLLALHKKQMDHEVYFFYDITSKISLHQLLSRKKLSKHELLSILKSLIAGIKLGEEYLLQGGSFLLHSDYIYVDPATTELAIAYLPLAADFDLKQAVREFLMDIIVYKVSLEAPNQGDFVYELLNVLKGEGFNLIQLDKMLDSLALQQECATTESITQERISMAKGQTALVVPKPKETLPNNEILIFAFIQVLLAALTALLIRYFLSQAQSFSPTNMIGLLCIIIAIDILLVKKLKLFKKTKLHSHAQVKSKTDFSSSLYEKAKPQKDKKLKQEKLHKPVDEKYADEQVLKSYIIPMDLETRVLQSDSMSLPYLQSMEEDISEKIFIDKPSFIIGRLKAQVDYVSKNNAVGKLHAEIVNKEGVFYIKDLNSRNGTYINGERMTGNVEYLIQKNDRVSFANSEFRFVQN